MSKPKLLLTGATGFVGRAVRSSLEANGWSVRCLTRNINRARRIDPKADWVEGDLNQPKTYEEAMSGCKAAFYLVHSMGEGADYHRREVRAAEHFAAKSEAAGIERIIYLGGLAPNGVASEHLLSRLEVGKVLRSGAVPTIELRASMIVGHGSLSWLIVRDLAARLPVMVLPRWLKSRTQPVAVDDIVLALVRSLDIPLTESAWFELPGPDVLSGREILEETSRIMGLSAPLMLEVPLLSPRLSSWWVRLVTRAQWSVAREVVVGLADDILAGDRSFWPLIRHPSPLSFSESVARAIQREADAPPEHGFWERIEKLRASGR